MWVILGFCNVDSLQYPKVYMFTSIRVNVCVFASLEEDQHHLTDMPTLLASAQISISPFFSVTSD